MDLPLRYPGPLAHKPTVENGVANLEGLRILVVDDNEVNRKVAMGILLKMGCHVELVDGGINALRHLARFDVDVVLMDCQMPDPDGLETTLRLRKWQQDPDPVRRRSASLPVLALTADATSEIRERCLESGMDDLLTKPYRSEQLRAVLARWAGGRG